MKDAPLYENLLDIDSCLGIYYHMMHAQKVRNKKKKELLKSLIEEAKKAYEAGQAEVAWQEFVHEQACGVCPYKHIKLNHKLTAS